MLDKEPQVKPLFQLPLMPGKRHITPPPSPAPAKPTARPSSPDTPAEIEEAMEDEEELDRQPPPHRLGSAVFGEQKRLARDTWSMRARASTMLRRALLNYAEQGHHRNRLIMIFLLVQAATLLLLLPGYLLSGLPAGSALLLLGELLLFGLAWLCNQIGRTWEACYLLVIGGGACVVTMMLLSASHRLSLETLLLSLLFLPVILAGGLLFTPETALIFSIISSCFLAALSLVFPLSPALTAVFAAQGRYLPLIFLMAAQLGVGIVGWLFGRQMQESVHVVTHQAELEMTNNRLRQRISRTDQKVEYLEAGIAVILQTHTRVAAGDYAARAHVEGELVPLAMSLNLLLERVEHLLQSANARPRVESAVAGLAALAGQGNQGAPAAAPPAPAGGALASASLAMKQMQAEVNQRLEHVQQSTAALVLTVGRCHDGLAPVADALAEHLRSLDSLVVAAEHCMSSTQRQVEMAACADALLRAAVPPAVSLSASEAPGLVKPGMSALRHAEEVEQRLAAEARAAGEAGSAQLGAATALEAGQSAPVALAAPSVAEESWPEAGSEPESPEAELMIAEGSPVIAAQQRRAIARAAQVSASSAAPGGAPARKITLAEVDREAAEEAALRGPAWDAAQLRALAELLKGLANEATQQERLARTLNIKLRLMLEGMPDTRRVDMIAASLRAVLGAIAQSAEQVRQASTALRPDPASSTPIPDFQSREKH